MRSPLVAILVRARLLVLLTEVDGVFTRAPGTPGAELVHGDPRLGTRSSERASLLGRGGMRSKVVAAEMAAAAGIPTVIAGVGASVLGPILDGEPRGARFHEDGRELSGYKVWLRFGKPVAGRLHVDAGAHHAVTAQDGACSPSGWSRARALRRG